MRSSVAITTALLAAGGAATPTYEGKRNAAVDRRLARRAVKAKGPQSHPEIATGGSDSKNWAGGVVSLSGFSDVNSYIEVPKVYTPAGGSKKTTYGGRAWVGIDGVGKCKSFANTGIEWTVKNNHTTYAVFYQVYPNPANYFNMTIDAGDALTISTSVASGVNVGFSVSNYETGESHSAGVNAGAHPLCQTYASWIVEDYTVHGSLVPLAHFDSVNFYDPEAGSYETSQVIDPSFGGKVTMQQKDTNLVSCFSGSGSFMGQSAGVLTCNYNA